VDAELAAGSALIKRDQQVEHLEHLECPLQRLSAGVCPRDEGVTHRWLDIVYRCMYMHKTGGEGITSVLTCDTRAMLHFLI
jgi:hypothetical protein